MITSTKCGTNNINFADFLGEKEEIIPPQQEPQKPSPQGSPVD